MTELAGLLQSGPVVIDGGLSTQLEAMGCRISDPLWTARVLVEDPEIVVAAHRAFIAAGARIVISASYQVSRAGFREVGLTDADADRALRASIAAARSAGGALVAASVGPYGAITHDGAEYRGRYGLSVDELASFHAERLAVLVDAGPDLLAVETIPDADEAAALLQALDAHPSIPAWVSFTAADGRRLWAGQAIEDAVRLVAGHPSVAAVGVNCTAPEHIDELIARIAQASDLPIVVYPNAGGAWDAASGTWDRAGGPGLDARVGDWVQSGARIIGGCCGTDAGAVRGIAHAVSSR